MRCPSCLKFATNDTSNEPEVSIDDPIWDPESKQLELNGSVRIVITSECCSEELKEATFDICESIDIEPQCDCDDFRVDVEPGEITERMETKTRTGRPITNSRYMRKYYGCAVMLTVTCECGKTEVAHEFIDETPASGMDELA